MRYRSPVAAATVLLAAGLATAAPPKVVTAPNSDAQCFAPWAANTKLLTDRKWIDLALIYASGKRAIITLEKDDKAEKMFQDVFTAWGKTANG